MTKAVGEVERCGYPVLTLPDHLQLQVAPGRVDELATGRSCGRSCGRVEDDRGDLRVGMQAILEPAERGAQLWIICSTGLMGIDDDCRRCQRAPADRPGENVEALDALETARDALVRARSELKGGDGQRKRDEQSRGAGRDGHRMAHDRPRETRPEVLLRLPPLGDGAR